MPRLEGEVAIVTSSRSGIGRASAMLFAAEGAHVVHCDVTEGCNETQRMLDAKGIEAAALRLDISDEDAAQRLVYDLLRRYQLDAAVLRASFRCIVARHKAGLPVAVRNQMARRNTMLFEIACDRIGAPL